jgi:hypothetical protein
MLRHVRHAAILSCIRWSCGPGSVARLFFRPGWVGLFGPDTLVAGLLLDMILTLALAVRCDRGSQCASFKLLGALGLVGGTDSCDRLTCAGAISSAIIRFWKGSGRPISRSPFVGEPCAMDSSSHQSKSGVFQSKVSAESRPRPREIQLYTDHWHHPEALSTFRDGVARIAEDCSVLLL